MKMDMGFVFSGTSGMSSPLRHADTGSYAADLNFKTPSQLGRSNSLPHPYGQQGPSTRMPGDPGLTRSISDVTSDHYPIRMMQPQDVSHCCVWHSGIVILASACVIVMCSGHSEFILHAK